MQVHHRASVSPLTTNGITASARSIERSIGSCSSRRGGFSTKLTTSGFAAGSRALGNQVARMPDAEAQPPVVLRRQVRGNVLQAVVSAAAAAELHLDGSRRQIQFVVRDENLVGQDLEELRDGATTDARTGS